MDKELFDVNQYFHITVWLFATDQEPSKITIACLKKALQYLVSVAQLNPSHKICTQCTHIRSPRDDHPRSEVFEL